jgi:polyhydroxyalkanoate synthesis regulator phasin
VCADNPIVPAAELQKIEDARIARMVREIQSDMADLVASGDMTAEEANEWVNRKADQWMVGGLS